MSGQFWFVQVYVAACLVGAWKVYEPGQLWPDTSVVLTLLGGSIVGVAGWILLQYAVLKWHRPREDETEVKEDAG